MEIRDIVICQKLDDIAGNRWGLIVGHKYIIRDKINLPRDRTRITAIGVEHLTSGKSLGIFDSEYFIPLSQYREEQIDKILNGSNI